MRLAVLAVLLALSACKPGDDPPPDPQATAAKPAPTILDDQLKTMRGLQDVEIDAEERRLGLNIKGDDARHRRDIESKRLDQDGQLDKIKALRSPKAYEQIGTLSAAGGGQE